MSTFVPQRSNHNFIPQNTLLGPGPPQAHRNTSQVCNRAGNEFRKTFLSDIDEGETRLSDPDDDYGDDDEDESLGSSYDDGTIGGSSDEEDAPLDKLPPGPSWLYAKYPPPAPPRSPPPPFPSPTHFPNVSYHRPVPMYHIFPQCQYMTPNARVQYVNRELPNIPKTHPNLSLNNIATDTIIPAFDIIILNHCLACLPADIHNPSEVVITHARSFAADNLLTKNLGDGDGIDFAYNQEHRSWTVSLRTKPKGLDTFLRVDRSREEICEEVAKRKDANLQRLRRQRNGEELARRRKGIFQNWDFVVGEPIEVVKNAQGVRELIMKDREESMGAGKEPRMRGGGHPNKTGRFPVRSSLKGSRNSGSSFGLGGDGECAMKRAPRRVHWEDESDGDANEMKIDAKEPEAMRIDAMEPDAMEVDSAEPDAMDYAYADEAGVRNTTVDVEQRWATDSAAGND